VRPIDIKDADKDNKERPLESLRKYQLARGLLPEEIQCFMTHRGQVPLYDIVKIEASSGTGFLNPGDTITLPPGIVHRITACKDNLVIIEVSTQPKNDSIRIGQK